MSKHIRLEKLDGDIYHLVFDRNSSSANIFDSATLAELNQHLDRLEKEHPKGLIVSSAKPSIFIAGADITELLSPDITGEALTEMVSAGQRTFQRINDLPCPSVAAIHGACLGGGFELALACDYRLASPDRATKIGLPETSLGILPAWGGCYRLPRLIGVPKALDAILNGKRMVAKQARKYGMVDVVVAREHFERFARKKIAEGKFFGRSHFMTNNKLATAIAARQAEKLTRKKSGGHYPALPEAIRVITRGVHLSREKTFAMEQRATVKLAQSDVCKNLVRIFFLQERAKKLNPAGKRRTPFHATHVAVVGAGIMGGGIAQWAASRGLQVLLKDIGEKQLLRGMANISKLFYQAVKRRLFTRVEAARAMDRICPSASDVPLTQTDLVIEAAVENMAIKKKIFAGLAKQSSPETILATNTSALSVTELAESVTYPERVIGVHFFNPVHRMQLVEVVVGENTLPRVVDQTVQFVQKIGKLPVVVKDSPGFVVNRILMPYMIEAGTLFENGASAENIDKAMLRFGMPMGPLRLSDEVGIDVAHHVAAFLSSQYADRMTTPELLSRMMQADCLGRKSGKGFYTYSSKTTSGNPELEAMISHGEAAELNRDELTQRLVLPMINEAARCLEEQVVEDPADIDFAMIMGTGFAPFRGGPLRYADTVGLPRLIKLFDGLTERAGSRYTPCDLIKTMAEKEQTFYPTS